MEAASAGFARGLGEWTLPQVSFRRQPSMSSPPTLSLLSAQTQHHPEPHPTAPISTEKSAFYCPQHATHGDDWMDAHANASDGKDTSHLFNKKRVDWRRALSEGATRGLFVPAVSCSVFLRDAYGNDAGGRHGYSHRSDASRGLKLAVAVAVAPGVPGDPEVYTVGGVGRWGANGANGEVERQLFSLFRRASFFRSLSLSPSLSLSLSLSHTHTHTHTQPLALALALSLSRSLALLLPPSRLAAVSTGTMARARSRSPTPLVGQN